MAYPTLGLPFQVTLRNGVKKRNKRASYLFVTKQNNCQLATKQGFIWLGGTDYFYFFVAPEDKSRSPNWFRFEFKVRHSFE